MGMKKNLILLLAILLVGVTASIAAPHTNYVTATGANGATITATITADAADITQPVFAALPVGWTIVGRIDLPGGDFIDFTEADLAQIIYTYSGTDFAHPGTYTDINFFGLNKNSNLGDAYNGQGTAAFEFTITGTVSDVLIISTSPAPPAPASPAVPVSPWAVAGIFGIIGLGIFFKFHKQANIA